MFAISHRLIRSADTPEDRIQRFNTVEPDWEAREERALVRKLDARVLFPCGTF
jgi:hypothetical protein